MPDYIGNIPVPEITPSGVFPLAPDYPHGRAQAPQVVVHQFGSGNAKIEQRFLLGVEGILGIESDAVPPVYLPRAASIRDIYAYCRNAPLGDNIEAVVKVNGNPLGTVVIQDGQTWPANSIDGKDLPAIQPGQPITLDITSVGSTYPGERLVVTIRL